MMTPNPLAASLVALMVAGAAGANPAPVAEVLGSLEIPVTGPEGQPVEELSGLAWDADENLLYAVSDRGMLHQFRLRLDGRRLAGVDLIRSAPLTGADGQPLAISDAEDVAVVRASNGIRGDSELLIALEDGPAIARFSTQGQQIAAVTLPAPLADPAGYAKANQRLESVAFDARHGVVTAPESPLQGQPEDLHRLYSTDGASWAFPAFPGKQSRVKAIEFTPSGQALVLERTREAKGAPQIGRLRRIDLAACDGQGVCPVSDLAPSDAAGMENNFEGMTRLSDDLLLLVTDRAAKDAQRTSLTLIGLPPAS